MKKLIKQSITLAICCITAFSLFTIKTEAYDEQKLISTSTEYLEDGLVCETIIYETQDSSTFTKASSKTKSGSKIMNYKTSGGTILWSVTVNATFQYTGSSSSCTSASVSTKIVNSNWKITAKSSNRSGNTGTAKATAKLYNNNTVTQTITKSVSLSCSKSGVLS